MDKFEVKGKTFHEKKLIQLETLLNIEIPVSGAIFVIWWFLPLGLLYLIFFAAIILLPIFVISLGVLLFQLRKFGWLFSLIIFVILPLSIALFYSDGSATFPIYYIYPLAMFGFYSLFLRAVVSTWP